MNKHYFYQVKIVEVGLMSFRNFFVDMSGPFLPDSRQNNYVNINTREMKTSQPYIFSFPVVR